MLKNYLKIALRNFRKHKAYTFINIFGLAVGIACCLLLLLHIQDELNFDGFHNKADRIYRIVEQRSTPDQSDQHNGVTFPALGPAMVNDFPEVESAVRFFQGWRLTIKEGETAQIARNYLFSEPGFFQVFDFELLEGDPNTALRAPRSIVLTESFARQLFGEENPLGKPLNIEAEDFPEFGRNEYLVTGLLRDIPHNSHLDFKFLISLSTVHEFEDWRDLLTSWTSSFMPTYLVLQEGNSSAELESKFVDFSKKYRGEEAWAKRKFYLQPLKDIHFYSTHIGFEQNRSEGDLTFVYIFSLIAVFILIIAGINYMNLATARSLVRAKEVGLRKVVGAFKRQLVGQFLGESILTSFLAMIVAIGFVEFALPRFNSLAGKTLTFDLSGNTFLWLGMLGITLFIGIISGFYPALYLTRFRPVTVIKGGTEKAGQSGIRQALVVTQFTLSIIMIVVTLFYSRQVDYLRSKNLGFNKDHLVVFDINHDDVQTNWRTVKTELMRNSAIKKVTVSSRVPGDWKSFRRIQVVKEGDADTETTSMFFNGVDEDFVQTYEIEVVQGRNFLREMASDSSAVLLNETAAKTLFNNSPMGKQIKIPRYSFVGHIVGVVQDFNYHSLHSEISPMVLGFMPDGGRHSVHGIDYFTMRISGENIPQTIEFITGVHEQVDPINPIEYAFLDTWLHNQYESDEQVGSIFGVAAGLAILIACVGLFGLATFMAEQRTKEIGIRKVLGATISNIILLVSKEFTKTLVIGLIIASPIAYFAMDRWLDEFAYRIDLDIWTFLLAGLITLFIALVTVSYQAIKAALANPVEALKYE